MEASPRSALPTGRTHSGMGSTPSALTESSAHTRQIEPRSGQVISEQYSLRGVDAPSADSSENLGDLWRGRGGLLRLRRQLSLPDLLFEGRGCVGPRMTQPPPLRVPPNRPDSAGYRANQGVGTQGNRGGPPVEESALVVKTDSAAHSSPLAHSYEMGPSVSSKQDNLAPSARSVGPAPLAARREPASFSGSVLNTISEARALRGLRGASMPLNGLCSPRGKNLSTSDLSVVLSFLQELLDKGHSPSTLKVYVAAIAASHDPGQEHFGCLLLEGCQEAESALAPHSPYMGLAHGVEGPEWSSL